MLIKELDYYRCLRKLAKEFNVEIWVLSIPTDVKVYLEYDKEKDRFKPRIILFPNWIFFEKEFLDEVTYVCEKLKVSLCDVLRYWIEYAIQIVSFREFLWRNCRDLFKYALFIHICEDAWCSVWSLENRFSIVEAIEEFNLKDFKKFKEEYVKSIEEHYLLANKLLEEVYSLIAVGNLHLATRVYIRSLDHIITLYRYAVIFKIVHNRFRPNSYMEFINNLVKRGLLEEDEVDFINDLVSAVETYCKNPCKCVEQLKEVCKYHKYPMHLVKTYELITDVIKKPTILPIINLVVTYEDIYLMWSNHIELIFIPK